MKTNKLIDKDSTNPQLLNAIDPNCPKCGHSLRFKVIKQESLDKLFSYAYDWVWCRSCLYEKKNNLIIVNYKVTPRK